MKPLASPVGLVGGGHSMKNYIVTSAQAFEFHNRNYLSSALSGDE
jgi:hypothetical protein